MQRVIVLTFGFLLTFSINAIAAPDCHIEKQATLPIMFNGFLPMVPANINGHALNIGIDTGSQGSTVTPESVDQLHLPKDSHHFTNVNGTGNTSVVGNVVLDDLEFAGARYVQKSVPVLSLSHKPSTDEIRDFGAPTLPMTGLIGADILSNYDIEFDVPAHTLTLYRVTKCARITPPWQGHYVAMHVSITATRRMAFPISLDGHPLTTLFDTGSSGLRLALASTPRVGVTEDMLAHDSAHEGTGVGGQTYRSVSHQFGSIRIGAETFRGPRIDVVDFPAREADMLIGEDYMHVRRFWLSYATHTLFIQRLNAH